MSPLQNRLVQVVSGACVILGLLGLTLAIAQFFVVGYFDEESFYPMIIGAGLCGIGWAIRYVFTGKTK